MKKIILYTVSILAILTSAAGYTYFSADYLFLENSSLKGINAITVVVEPPVNSVNNELLNYGVSAKDLQKRISDRLQAVGIDIVSLEQGKSNPDAAILLLRINLIIGHGAVYSYGLNLSVNQKMSLTRPNASYPVRTWSTGKFGGTQQTNLRIINGYTMELVEDFVTAYQSDNY